MEIISLRCPFRADAFLLPLKSINLYVCVALLNSRYLLTHCVLFSNICIKVIILWIGEFRFFFFFFFCISSLRHLWPLCIAVNGIHFFIVSVIAVATHTSSSKQFQYWNKFHQKPLENSLTVRWTVFFSC